MSPLLEEGIDYHFARCGHAYLAFKPGHFAKLRGAVDWYAKNLDYHDMFAVGADALHIEPSRMALSCASFAQQKSDACTGQRDNMALPCSPWRVTALVR